MFSPGRWQRPWPRYTYYPDAKVRWTNIIYYIRRRGVLGISSGVHDIGKVQWELLVCFLVGWIVVYFCIWKGIGWTSKVSRLYKTKLTLNIITILLTLCFKIVYFTASFPLIMLLVLFVRGVTLDGASYGIEYYLKPNMTKLQEPQVIYCTVINLRNY